MTAAAVAMIIGFLFAEFIIIRSLLYLTPA
jgi:hypothetical protein